MRGAPQIARFLHGLGQNRKSTALYAIERHGEEQ